MTVKTKPLSGSEISASITKIYDRFQIPSSLRMHMFRVAAVGSLICDNWEGPKINTGDVCGALLLHDLGNIVKFPLNEITKTALPPEELARIDFWREVKANVISRYGSDDHSATLNMVRELGVGSGVLRLIDQLGEAEDLKSDIVQSEDLGLKICFYSDFRVGFNGIISIQQRFDDLVKRYEGTPKSAIWKTLRTPCFKVEQELFDQTAIRPSEISDHAILPYLHAFRAAAE